MKSERFCELLPSRPDPALGTILVTGASGYIGGRLVPELLARGYRVRTMIRAEMHGHRERWPGVEEAIADAADPAALREAMRGVHAAYYLIHSLLLGPRQFEAADIQNARNFREAAAAAGVRRLIYLGGLGDVRTFLSAHLRSRTRVAEELQGGAVPTTVLRAAVIIGSGSASYEIILSLTRRLPVFIIPSWGRTRCQPIAIRDVIRYLVGVLETPATAGRSFDIGGRDVLSYEAMMRTMAAMIKRRALFIHVPRAFSSIRPYAYMAGLITPVPVPIVASLMEGLRNDVVCQDDSIRSLIAFDPSSYKEAILEAMSREERDEIHTRWSDAYPPAHELAIKLDEVDPPPHYRSAYSLVSAKPADALFRSICGIGGREGWFQGNWMWRLRGMLDRMLMGVGTARGRRSHASLRANDVIDFWRVERIVADRRLLLRAEMRLPGRAWLEFRIDPEPAGNRLSVIAHYDTKTWPGHLYWYVFLPFHTYIFENLIRQIERRS